MINTVAIKHQQLTGGFFQSGSGSEKILIMGSCRVAPYVDYLDKWNKQNGNRFTIFSLDPFNHNWNGNNDRVDYAEALYKCESDERLLSMLKSVDIFIHEYYQNAGMFNCNKIDPRNIYNFGVNPKQDITLPNFNDLFIMFGDIVTFDTDMRKKAIQDYNVIGKLSEETKRDIFGISHNNIRKFYEVCGKSDIPEMAEYFQDQYLKRRLYWNYNHVSKWFTLAMLQFLNIKFLNLELSQDFMNEISKEDMFANNYTYLTEYDIECFGYEWGEEIKDLRERL